MPKILNRLILSAIVGTSSLTVLATDAPTLTVGSYNAGCIRGSQALPLNGAGYQVMRPSRQRYFGHPELLGFIQYLGHAVAAQQLGTLLIGDLAQHYGGPMPSGHRSHQTGLDVDIWYWLDSPATAQELSTEQRETLSAPAYVDETTLKILQPNWQAAHTEVLKAAASHPQVERIFVNPAIKAYLCQTIGADERHWLHKIRPWWHHADHFHVRLKCPAGEVMCENQAAVDLGAGCDASLEDWFKPAKPSNNKKPSPPPPLPAECTAILAGH